LDTTRKLLGLGLLVVEVTIVVAATQLEGIAQTILIVGALFIFILTIVGGIYLEIMERKPPSLPIHPPETTITYAVFISTPMDAYTDDQSRQEHRDKILQIKDALRQCCKFEPTFYAGTDIVDEEGFQSPAVALRQNFQKMQESKRFIMIYPERLPSSILVEAGMALALGKDSVWFVKSPQSLPFLLREASNASKQDGLPNIRIYKYNSIEDILNWIDRDRQDLFEN
jgi:hypothetical protein